MKRLRYCCNKCGYYGKTSAHPHCNYLAAGFRVHVFSWCSLFWNALPSFLFRPPFYPALWDMIDSWDYWKK